MPVGEVLAAGAVLDEVFVDAEAWADAEPGSPLHDAVGAAAAAGTPVWSLAPGVLAKVTDTVTPQGLVAVAPRRPADLERLSDGRAAPVRPGARARRRGRSGQRRAPSCGPPRRPGAAGVVFAGACTDPFGPKAVRAAAGSLLRLPVAEARRRRSGASTALRAGGRRLVATVATGGASPEALDLTGPVAVLVGSEAHGLPGGGRGRGRSPASPSRSIAGVESLNAAVAGSVVLFEAARQRRLVERRAPSMSAPEPIGRPKLDRQARRPMIDDITHRRSGRRPRRASPPPPRSTSCVPSRASCSARRAS